MAVDRGELNSDVEQVLGAPAGSWSGRRGRLKGGRKKEATAMRAHMVIKRVVLFGVVWLVSAVVTVGVLTVAAGVPEANTSPPDPPSELPDIMPVGGPDGEIIGWVYHPPIDLSSPPPSELPADPEQSWWMYSPQTREWHPSEAPPYNVKRTIENGGETEVIEIPNSPSGVRFHPGPVYKTREEAERYRDALLTGSGSVRAPVNVND